MRYARLMLCTATVLIAGCTANERSFTYPPQSSVEAPQTPARNSMSATGNESNLHERASERTGTGGQTGN